MPLFEECCVLIPSATLEDFPSDLSDCDARSLLAAWTILWHPSLLAEAGQLPVWYRADSPPESVEHRLIAAPSPIVAQLPDGFSARAADCPSCRWISGGSRSEMLQQLPLESLRGLSRNHLSVGARTIGIEDFFAAGYAWLQIQVMTKRLRYTSNIDELHLQGRVLAAAEAFLDGNAGEANNALHDVFDCLAEERDHYFSSDPHLIDLVLTSRSTVDQLLDLIDSDERFAPPLGDDPDNTQGAPEETIDAETNDAESTAVAAKDVAAEGLGNDAAVLGTPCNLLIDDDVAAAIGELDSSRTETIRKRLASGQIGWAGGGPRASSSLDAMTYSQAELAFEQAYDQISNAVGTAPPVYGRFSGTTPSDLTGTLVRLGYCGMIPIDFAGGSGFGDEAKVLMQSAGAELEALTAKPIDASSDASFLTLGTRLGEAIDSGEIATALLAHWPGQSCDAFEDLRRVASWSLCLGRFWSLASYFRDGEHPYHHGTSVTSSPQSAEALSDSIAAEKANPISSVAESFRQALVDEQRYLFSGMLDLVGGEAGDDGAKQPGSPSGFAAAIGAPTCDTAEANDGSLLVVNPHSVGCRVQVETSGGMPPKSAHLYAATHEGGRTAATIDVPGCGFVLLRSDHAKGESRGFGSRLRQKLLGGPKSIAENDHLHNEFMEITISGESGGVSGVYSGTTRGNRFSLRFIRSGIPDDETTMRCASLRVVSSTPSRGCLEAAGTIEGVKTSDSSQDSVLADFRIRYTLERGSRFLRVEGEIEPRTPIEGDPWSHYFAARAAVANEAPICRALIRDKLHRAKSRRIVAPLGVLLDEADRFTLVCGNGLAYHRRVGERFLDTPIIVQGETCKKFTLHYGFDVSAPIAAARARIVPPTHLAVQPTQGTPDIGWILHSAPKDILVSQLRTVRRPDGNLSSVVRIIQTQPQACKATLRFFRDVQAAVFVDGSLDRLSQLSVGDLQADNSGLRSDLKYEGDMVSLSMRSHAVADILVVFASD